jgi:hypothetical protein
MAQQVVYVADERTARMTPDAFRVRLEQSRFRVKSQREDGDEVELEIDGGLTLWLLVEGGYVVEVEGAITFANDRRSNLLLELLQSMGFLAADDA